MHYFITFKCIVNINILLSYFHLYVACDLTFIEYFNGFNFYYFYFLHSHATSVKYLLSCVLIVHAKCWRDNNIILWDQYTFILLLKPPVPEWFNWYFGNILLLTISYNLQAISFIIVSSKVTRAYFMLSMA